MSGKLRRDDRGRFVPRPVPRRDDRGRFAPVRVPRRDNLGRFAPGRAVKRAGIPDKLSYNHILRHTFASHAVMDGVPLVTVSKWLGHTTVHMTLRYSHLAESESQRQMQSFSLSVAPSPTSKDPGD